MFFFEKKQISLKIPSEKQHDPTWREQLFFLGGNFGCFKISPKSKRWTLKSRLIDLLFGDGTWWWNVRNAPSLSWNYLFIPSRERRYSHFGKRKNVFKNDLEGARAMLVWERVYWYSNLHFTMRIQCFSRICFLRVLKPTNAVFPKQHPCAKQSMRFFVAVEREQWKFDTLCDLYDTLTITQVRKSRDFFFVDYLLWKVTGAFKDHPLRW